MYPGEIVHIEDAQYVLGAYLSSGLIGTVFPAWEKIKCVAGEIPSNEKCGEPDRAIKVLAPNAAETLRERFRSEFKVLSSTNEKWSRQFSEIPSPFPAAKEGDWQGQELLAMEFVAPEWDFGTALANQKSALARERFCLRQAVRYAQMLQVIHQAGYVCLDRKPIDIYFDVSQARLIVLDWNVVESYNTEKVAEEHAIFAAMWYGFLTGKVPPSDFNPLEDELWGDVSLGTRSFLSDLLLGRYKDDAKLIENLDKYEKQFDQSALELLERAPSIDQIKGYEKQGNPSGDLYWEGLALRDVARQVADEQQPYERQFDDFQNFFRERFGRLFFEAQMSLRKEMYDDGLAYLQKIRETIQGDANLELQYERWRVLLEAGKVASEKGLSFFNVSHVFQNWQKTTQESEPKSGHAWRQVFGEFVKVEKFQEFVANHPALSAFETEIQIREKWDEVKQNLKDSKGSTVSGQHYRNIQITLNDIANLLGESPTTYAGALRQVLFPDFEIWKRRVDDRVNAEVEFYDIGQGVEKTFLDAPLRYIRYRFRDIDLSDRQQIESFRSTLEFLEVQAELVKDGKPFADNLLSGKLQILLWNDEDLMDVLSQKIKYLIEKDALIHKVSQEQVKSLTEQEKEPVAHTLHEQVENRIQKEFDHPSQIVSRFVWRVSGEPEDTLQTWADAGAVAELRMAFHALLPKGQSPDSLSTDLRDCIKKIKESLEKEIKGLPWQFDTQSRKEWLEYLVYWAPNSDVEG
jgi:hypothetical protein